MRQVMNIFKKEFGAYFVSPIAYIVISIFLLVTGWLFFTTFFLYNQANLRNFFGLLPITFSFVVPAVTMRLFSEEMNTGSYEILATLPLNYIEIILGKFLASVAFICIMLLPTISYAITITTMVLWTGVRFWEVILEPYYSAPCFQLSDYLPAP